MFVELVAGSIWAGGLIAIGISASSAAGPPRSAAPASLGQARDPEVTIAVLKLPTMWRVSVYHWVQWFRHDLRRGGDLMPAGAQRVYAPDPIRIVPVYRVDELVQPAHGAAAAAGPQLSYRGGALLTTVEVFTVFWGSWWQASEGASLVTELNGFFDYVLTSELIDQLGEYSVSGQTIGHGSRIGTTTIAEPALGASISDAQIQQTLQQLAGAGTVPSPTANTLYFLYLPPNVSVTQGGSRSCQAFCGYHNATSADLYYAVMPYPGCTGCAGGLALVDALTSTSSHELCEAITDPVPGQGWYDDHNGEIGDICAWKTRPLGSYTVQLEWSNKQNACV